MARIILVIIGWSFGTLGYAQTVIALAECDVAYIDPQDEAGNTNPTQDTLIYTEYFTANNQSRAYLVDINAFGGQQIDRCYVFAILPDEQRKPLGSLSFGNCIGCVDGFALEDQDSLLVSEVSSREEMDMWIQSLSQPPFALSGNLQTLTGVGRISGRVPPCAIGIEVRYIVFSNPQSTTTEFSTYIHCSEIVSDCEITLAANLDCQADSLYLAATIPSACYPANATVRWFDQLGWTSDGVQASRPLTGQEGWYYFSVTDECCTVLDSILVENPPFAEAGPDQFVCLDQPLTLAGQGGMGHYWTYPDGTTGQDSVVLISNTSTAHAGGFILHAFNEEGCADTDTLMITVHTPATPEVNIPNLCLGDSLLLTIDNATAYTAAVWTHPMGSELSPALITDFQATDIGLYTLQTIDTAGCADTNTYPVNGGEPPAIESVIEEHCDSATVYLFPEEYAYSWEDGSQGSRYTAYSGGEYLVTITDASGCSSRSTIAVPEPDGPGVMVVVDQPFCPGDFGRIEIVADDPHRPLIFSIDGGATYGVQPNYERLTPGQYTVVVQDDVGCIQSFPVELFQPDTMGVSLPESVLNVRPLTPITLEATTIGNIQQYTWLPRAIDSGTAETSFTALHNLDIRIVVEDDRGCRASAGLPLTIVLGDIYAPNVFSPNNDGFNDRFTLYSDNRSGEIIQYLRIFDRQGGLVFETQETALNDEGTGWNGTFQGKPLNTGVYTYHGIVRFGNGVTQVYNGDVLLVR